MKSKRASDVMTSPVVTISQDRLLTEAIQFLLRHHISGLPVIDDNGLMIGIITEHDIMNFALSGDAADTRVSEAMTRDVESVAADDPIENVISLLSSRNIRRVPILRGKTLVGIVSRRDVLREMLRRYSEY